MSTYTKNLNLFKYDVTADEKVPFSITDALNNNWDIIDEKCNGGGLEICDIGMTLYVDETKGLRRYLNGQIVDINTNTRPFLNRLQQITTLHPSLLCTEEEWQTAKTMSAFGQVGKFVFNYSGDEIISVRIPTIVNVQGLFDLQNLGMTVDAGLPNINGFSRLRASILNDTENDGALSVNMGAGSTSNAATSSGSSKAGDNLVFNASSSNAIYGNSDTVQPEAIQYPYFIQISTGSETENNIINEIELNNPFSLLDYKYSEYELNNLSWLRSNGQYNSKATYPAVYDLLLKIYNGTETKAGVSVKLSTETYTDYDFVLNTANETFRLPLKTNLASGKAINGNGMALGLMTKDTTKDYYASFHYASNSYAAIQPYSSVNIPQASSSSGALSNSNASSLNNGYIGITTDPTKSGIETSDSGLYLYFYVGETVQNANLIDAGRIGEQLANKVDINSKVIDGQWVSKTATLSTATAVGTYTIDLSDYLPNDTYNYEVLVSYTIALSSNTTGTRGYITSDVLGEDNYLDIASISPMPTSGYYNRAAGGVIIPAKNSLTFKIGTGKATGVTLSANAYRRIGTNQ